MKRLMWVPLNSFGRSTNMPMVATVFWTSVRFVPDLDRKTQAAHTDFVDAQFTMVALALFVVKFGPARKLFCN